MARISHETTTTEPLPETDELDPETVASLKSYLKELDKYLAVAGRPR